MVMIRCPWPPKPLWSNDRSPRWKKAKATQVYRQTCFALALEQSVHKRKWPAGTINVHLTFHPMGEPDDDNLEAAFKAGRDGIADAMKVNDKNFKVTREIGHKVKGGCVVVRIET